MRTSWNLGHRPSHHCFQDILGHGGSALRDVILRGLTSSAAARKMRHQESRHQHHHQAALFAGCGRGGAATPQCRQQCSARGATATMAISMKSMNLTVGEKTEATTCEESSGYQGIRDSCHEHVDAVVAREGRCRE